MTFKIHACKAMSEENWGLMLQHDGICGYCGEDLEKEQLLSQLAAVTAERYEARADIREWEASREEATAQFAALLAERDAALARVAQLEGALEHAVDGLQNAWEDLSHCEEERCVPWVGEVSSCRASMDEAREALSQSPSEALASGHSARSQEYRKSISPEQEAAVRMAQLQLSTIVNRCHQTVAGDREIATEALKALADAFGEGEGAL